VPNHQDPDTRAAAVAALFRASALLDPFRLLLWDRDNLTVTQLRLLGHLLESEGISNAELADRLYVTRPSVSALLERLERGGFIRREVSPTDRRGICIWLEPRGREAVSSIRDDAHEYAAGLMEELSDDDLKDIAAALEKLVAAGAARRARDLHSGGNGSGDSSDG
jgi:DNA-binding MarR family transcriptional regulator